MSAARLKARDPDAIRAFARTLPGAEESSHHGTPDLRVRGRIFAALSAADTVTLKCAPANLDALVRLDPETFHRGWAGRWLQVRTEDADLEQLEGLIVDAWSLVAPKRMVQAYHEGAGE